MTKRVKTTTIKEEIPESALPESVPASQLPLDESSIELTERLSQIRTSLGAGSDDITIKVYRVAPGKNPAFCFSDKAVDEEKIQQRCGAGSFQCKIISGGAVIDIIDVEIDASVLPQVNAPAHNNDPIITLLMQQNSQFMQAFTTMLANNGQSQRSPLGELVDVVKTVKELAGGGSDATAMKMFEKGVDLATKIGGFGEKSWTTELFETIKEVAQPLVPAIVQGLSNGKQPQQLPNGQVVDVTTLTPEQQNEMYLRQAIAGIKQQALANVPVSLVLEWIENHANEYANLIRIVVTSDFATIAKLDPDIANEPLSTYFKSLYDGLRQSHLESATMDVDSTGEDGNEEDDSIHGGISTPVVVESGTVHTGNKPRKRTGN